MRASRSRSCWRRHSKPPSTPRRWCRQTSSRRRSRPHPRGGSRRRRGAARERIPVRARGRRARRRRAGVRGRAGAPRGDLRPALAPPQPDGALGDAGASGEDGTLTMVDATQWAYGVRIVMCALFGIAPERVRVRSPHTGGAFGCKGLVWPHQIIAAAAARVAGRPVRIALSRAQMYSIVPYQPQMVQTVSLAASGDGRLAAIEHESINVTSVSDDFVEYATMASQTTYAAPAIRVRQRVQRANVNLGTAMRAPARGVRALGAGKRDQRARRPAADRPDRAAPRQPRRRAPVHRAAVVIEEAARVLRAGGARVRMAPASQRARARRPMAGGPGDGRLRDGHDFASRRTRRCACTPTAGR